jgi:hypothetical protein
MNSSVLLMVFLDQFLVIVKIVIQAYFD